MSKAKRPFEVVHCLLTSVGEEVVKGWGIMGEVGSGREGEAELENTH